MSFKFKSVHANICKEKEIVLKDYDKMINQDGLTKEQILDYLNDHNFKCQ